MKKYRPIQQPKPILAKLAIVLSTHNKRNSLPDSSTAAERAAFIGKEIEIKNKPVIIIDAQKNNNVWYFQYVEVNR